MRNWILLIPLFLPLASIAQNIITVPENNCVWRAGDNPAWAAPNLDETGWQPYTQWKLNSDQPRYWVRCHANLSPLRGMERPAIQITLYAAYQLYLNGAQLGGMGNLRSGFFGMDAIRAFPAPAVGLNAQPDTLALRIAYRFSDLRYGGASLQLPAAHPYMAGIVTGDQLVLSQVRAASIWTHIPGSFIVFLSDGILGILGCVLLGLFLQDRSRVDLLLLSLDCIGVAGIAVRSLAACALLDWPVWLILGMYATSATIVTFSQTWFFFALAGRRVPWFFWIVAGLASLRYAFILPGVFLPLTSALRFSTVLFPVVVPASLLAGTFLGITPFAAFWPFKAIARRMMPLALLCMAWGTTTVFFFLSEPGSSVGPLFGITPGTLMRWHGTIDAVFTFVSFGVIVSLMGLLSRDQQRTARERALLAGEMQAARRVQQYLIPEQLPATPGFAIRSEYRPAREVGGDFFQVLPQAADGSVLVIVGDVAGKGVEAGMLAALIVGAIRTAFKFTGSPGEILALLNERLQGRGLVTCVAMRIHRNGSAELTSAGHLPPYLNGREVAVEGSLPLGAIPGIQFPIARFDLAPADTLTLISDGVVEARNPAGELFGFERTRQISNQPADEIAAAAQAFGQEDDITVLTLAFAPAEVLHA